MWTFVKIFTSLLYAERTTYSLVLPLVSIRIIFLQTIISVTVSIHVHCTIPIEYYISNEEKYRQDCRISFLNNCFHDRCKVIFSRFRSLSSQVCVTHPRLLIPPLRVTYYCVVVWFRFPALVVNPLETAEARVCFWKIVQINRLYCCTDEPFLQDFLEIY